MNLNLRSNEGLCDRLTGHTHRTPSRPHQDLPVGPLLSRPLVGEGALRKQHPRAMYVAAGGGSDMMMMMLTGQTPSSP